MSVSQTGTWMQNIAQPWLALEVTNNAGLVGIVAAIQFLPLLLFSVFSGVLLDRVDKKSILKITQTGLCLTSLLFGLSVLFNVVAYPIILILAFLTGLFTCLDSPCRQSFLHELLSDQKDLPNAVALNAVALNTARIIGPSLAGIIMAKFGVQVCFFINSISFIAILISLFFIKTYKKETNISHQGILESIKSGFNYIKINELLISPLIVILIIGALIPNFNVTISTFAKYTLKGTEETYGYLMAFLGIGSVFGAFWVAFTSMSISYKIVKIMPFISALALVLVGFSKNFWVAGLFLWFVGFSFNICTSTINSLLQLNSKEEFRGRVMSIYVLFFLGSTPLGAIFSGALVNEFGAGNSLIICGVIVYVLLITWWIFKSFYFKFKM